MASSARVLRRCACPHCLLLVAPAAGAALAGEYTHSEGGNTCNHAIIEIDMKVHTPNLIWLGAGLGATFWVAESLLHPFVFG
jgi:hypothetical protein